MSSDRPRFSSENRGIQTEGNVTAQAMAVGTNARAVSYGGAAEISDLHRAIAEMQRKLAELDLQPQQKQLLDTDVAGLKAAAAGDKPDLPKAEAHLAGIKDKLTMAGELDKVAAVMEPVSKILEALKIPLALLGLA